MNITEIAVFGGWKDQPDGRGTWDILKTCGGTIVLLCWSSVCPNIPTLGDRHPQKHNQMLLAEARRKFQQKFQQKFQLFLLAILGPDFIFAVALGQLQAAQEAQKKFENKNFERPSLRHCFFVNMGGFHAQFPDWEAGGRRSFAVNTEQLLFLVESGYVDMPSPSELEAAIDDRNKADGVARTITILQVVWFTINTIGRASQGLAITTLELTTMAFIFLMTATSICWWWKPMDVSSPIILDSKVDFKIVLTQAKIHSDQSQLAYHGTPLSFFGRDEWFMSRHWHYYTEILRKLRLAPKPTQPYQLDYLPSIQYHKHTFNFELVACPLILGYGSIFMIAWNFNFPTDEERVLWRTAAIMCLIYSALGGIIALLDQHGSVVASRISTLFSAQTVSHAFQPEPKTKSPPSVLMAAFFCLNGISDRLRNISPDEDPSMRIRLRILIPTTILCIAYSISRAYILTEDIISLRKLPESAFATMNWGQYSPLL